jgi:hypothetical protein
MTALQRGRINSYKISRQHRQLVHQGLGAKKVNETVCGCLDQEIDAKSHQIGDAHAKTPVEE